MATAWIDAKRNKFPGRPICGKDSCWRIGNWIKAAAGPRWLGDERVAQCVVDTLQYGEEELALYELHAWVLMMNHVHILIDPKTPLQKITKSIKNFSARRANAILGLTGQPFWQEESYDRWVRGAAAMARILHYIEENPVTAGLVDSAADWRWSSAFGATGQEAHRT